MEANRKEEEQLTVSYCCHNDKDARKIKENNYQAYLSS